MRRRRRLCPWSSWKPPKPLGQSASIAVYSTVACDARHRFGEYVVEHAEHVSIVIAKNYSGGASLAREATRANAKVATLPISELRPQVVHPTHPTCKAT